MATIEIKPTPAQIDILNSVSTLVNQARAQHELALKAIIAGHYPVGKLVSIKDDGTIVLEIPDVDIKPPTA